MQNAKQDFAPTYAHFVANNDMRKAIAYQDLARNKMYEAGDIGEVRMGKNVGPNELIKFYSEREQKMNEMIESYVTSQTQGRITHNGPVSAFIVDCCVSIIEGLNEF